MEKRPTEEQLAKYRKNAQDQSLSAEVRAKFQAVVDKFSTEAKKVEDEIEGKAEPKKRAGRKPATPRATKKPATPRATKKSATDIEQAKAEIKAKTGKTEAECEAIIEQYRSLRTKAQEGKRKAEQASADNKKRVEKLDQKGDLIEGTNIKTADAVIESTAKDVAEKIEKQIEAVEEKAQKEAKAEVAKDKTIKTTTDKKEAIDAKVDKKVKEKTKVVVERVVIDTSALLTSIATSLGKFDKDSQKEFLIKLRSDIDKLLAKYAFGGMTDGATQVMNVQQSNLSASSVNPTLFANGGRLENLRDEIKDLLEEIEFVSEDKSFTESEKQKYISELKKDIADKREKMRTYYHSEDKFANGGGIMADGRIVLRTFNGVGGNKNKTYKLIKDDRDSDGKPYYTLIEDQSGNVMAQGDSFDEVNGYANLMSGKFANGGGVGKENVFYREMLITLKGLKYTIGSTKNSDVRSKGIEVIMKNPSDNNVAIKRLKEASFDVFEENGKLYVSPTMILLYDLALREDKFADGGVIGQEIVFDDNGEENSGVIKDITNLGDYVVKADDGRTLLAQRDLDVISLGAMRQQGVEQRKKRFGFFDEGGNISDVEYDDVLAVLEDKLTDSVQELPNSFENSYNAEGEEVEHQSRDGFIAYTDGGFQVRWFETLSGFYGAGYSLPTKALENEKNRQIDLSLEDAKDYFKGEYPEIVEELGEDNINYNSLYEAGYESEAEDLSNVEMDMMDGTIMCEIGAYYYTPNNDRGIEGQHTLRLFGLVNLESPYHRSGNLEDRFDYDLTFDSIEELAEKVDEGLKAIIDWFNGSHYFKSTEELRIRRMAKGGLTEHGLKVGDRIEKKVDAKGEVIRVKNKKENAFVDLDAGYRMRIGEFTTMQKGGNVEREKFNTLIGKAGYEEFFFLDDIFTYKDGFKGATGTIVNPVSKEQYDYATSREGILERYMDAIGEEEWLDTLGLDSDDFEDENEMMEAIEEGIYDTYLNGGLDPFEQPNYEIEEQMRALPEYSDEDEYPIFEVVGGGRIFGKTNNFNKIYNKELYNRIREVEEFAKGGKLWIDTKGKGGLKGVKPSRKNTFRNEAVKRGLTSGQLASKVLASPSRYKGINPKSAQLVKNMGVRKQGGSIGDILRNRRGQ